MTLDIGHLKSWVGRQETVEDVVRPFPLTALSAVLDRDDPPARDGDPVPPLGHWLYCLPVYRQSTLGTDGHAQRGGFLPPVPLERRMWAGGRLTFPGQLRVGEKITRKSTVADVSMKDGRTGPLVFVLVKHEISSPAGLAITEEHDIVYREAPRKDEPVPPPKKARTDGAWRRDLKPDDPLLFRYSALTFNAHRIHYDRRYVTEVEGYPGLIVHGPLTATLLIDLLRRNSTARVTSFKFRAVKALFDINPMAVCGIRYGNKVALWAQDHEGNVAMEAEAELA
jgi:3-methylfumaryl-CoA hydratase